MTTKDFYIGQEVIIVCRGRFNAQPRITKTQIKKIGKKYVYTEYMPFSDFRIKIKSGRGEVCEKYQLYLDMQDFYDDERRNRLFKLIQDKFSWIHQEDYSLETLEKIYEIMKQED